MHSFSKSEMKELRKLAALAHECEITNELSKLEGSFSSWKQGKLSSFDLNDLIHKYHDGPQRELYKMYVMNNNASVIVASALARNILRGDQISKELYEKISPMFSLFSNN